ncbi:MAG TPA: amidase [Bryobacteraceae bacterium]|nr:amidase [Bryobacteraceae bacterium]
MNDDVFFAPITELNARLKKREFSAVDLVKAFGARLEKLGPRYNALALPLTRIAQKRAKDVDGELKRERFRGPLQGIPFGAKDLLSFAGYPTTWGAKPYANQVFDTTATVLDKLDGTGSLLIGKLSMIELAGGGGYRTAAASLTGPGLNPWDVTRWAGGSSSGPGSAVAAGLVSYALGSETSGSIITPAAYCGVTGLRPTYGLVSRHGAMALSWTLDKIGPICRTAEDCGLVLDAISGGDSSDPGSAGKSFYYAPQFVRPFRELKVGFASVDRDWADPAIRPVLDAAMSTMKDIGVELVEIELPDYPWDALISTIIGAESASVFEDLITSGQVDQLADPSQAESLKSKLAIAATQYLKAMRIRSLVQRSFRELFVNIDLIVAPARYEVAPKIGEPLDDEGPETPHPAKPGMTNLIPASNIAGLPGISFPCGFASGLPVGLQLVGPAFRENNLLAVAVEFQKRTDWHKRRPPALT